ncbi:SMI1/KNR4 family protein [Streptomyces liangshanensis]|uniref:SMI1/KNR4 family protein n=1 Tax=Streptomyces liangshanensis TaxID=2717324 RepID=A0A6G9GZY0_9ACTN|nr:SMI1/KNR4 family protein [Streptomyces liangshanensis]QIQ03521.1 SMI1/KNR4 family protein [Streptomyces liangshanensis]
MSDHDELIRRVRTLAVQESSPLPPCVDSAAVAEAERLLGFGLPPLLVRLYAEVANGGFGPDYTLFPLLGEGQTVVSEYGEQRPVQPAEPAGSIGPAEPEETWDSEPHWPHGVLPVLEWGCAMYAAVDCLRPDAPVLLFEPNGYVDDWAEVWFRDAPSLSEWLLRWVNGTGWWEEDATRSEDAVVPVPWPEAADRINVSAQ